MSATSKNRIEPDKNQIEPDKGWAWVILFAAFMSNVFVGGILYSFGVFYLEFLDYFGKGRSVTAWIGSVICCTYALIGPIVSVLTNKFGCRAVTIAGGFLVSSGFVLSTFCKTVWTMVITYGIMGGVGFGFVYPCGYSMISYYFDKKRPIALGIAACGSSVGGFIFAPMSVFLINKYSWQGAMLIIAAIALNDVAIGATYRSTDQGQGEDTEASAQAERSDLNDSSLPSDSSPKKKLLDLSILKLPACSIMCIATFIHMLGFYVPFLYLPDFARGIGIHRDKGALLLSIIGISNTVGRALAGIVSNATWGDALWINNAALLIAGGATLVLPWLTHFWQLCVYSVVFGICFGAVVSVSTIILVEFLGPRRLLESFGYLNAGCGLATLIGTPLGGFLYDFTGSYHIAFLTAGGVIFAAGLICLPLRTVHYCIVGKTPADEAENIENLSNGRLLKHNLIESENGVIKTPLMGLKLQDRNKLLYNSHSSLTMI